MDNKLISALEKICVGQDAAALVTIIKVKGSTPRKPGAKMVVSQDGTVVGTIGGGCGEAEVKREALHALDHLKPAKYVVNMTLDLAAAEGMVCGGVMEVLIDILPPGNNEEKWFLQQYIHCLAGNEKPTLMTVIEPALATGIQVSGKYYITSNGKTVSLSKDEEMTQKFALWNQKYQLDGETRLEKDGELELLIEPTPISVELIILGGGHIALPLSNIAGMLGYHVTVVDDRPLFANTERFSSADRVICESFRQATENFELTSESYVVIVTRGHRHDKHCLQAVINKPAAYIGMIGSKRRVKALLTELIAEGVPAEAVAKVHSPIGIDIGAQTPEEIAVSILAEIILVHRGGNARRH